MAKRLCLAALAIVASASAASAQAPQVPAAVAASGETTVATFQGVGAQVYECKAGSDGKLAWSFREPIATLINKGKTVGRHYAGPSWEDVDGSKIVGKAVGNAPGATTDDVPWLKLDVVKHQGRGLLSKVTTVQRLDTHGGALTGSCDKAGDFKSVAYSATYVFLHKGK
jgi:opacity protein-like surface antigen